MLEIRIDVCGCGIMWLLSAFVVFLNVIFNESEANLLIEYVFILSNFQVI